MRIWKKLGLLLVGLCLANTECRNTGAESARLNQANTSQTAARRIVTFWGPENQAMLDAGPDRPVELGMRFSSDVPAQLTSVRFYKMPTANGTHVANVWSSDGTLLASASFRKETASGWQEADLKETVALHANETYVVSYHESKGHYGYTKNFFTTPLNTPPLHAPISAGVFAYGVAATFPQQSFESSNYWVQPVVSTAAPPKFPKTITLSWRASTSPNVSYNIYRKTSSSEYYKAPPIVSKFHGLSYDDHVIASRGDKFYYVVRSVDRGDHESFDSNEVQVTIPQR